MHLIIWSFLVTPTRAAEFEKAYGSAGAWAQLFRQNPYFVRTELLRDQHVPERYFTLDYWQSAEQFQTFMRQHADAYKRLDEHLANLTTQEVKIGEFFIV